jgi:hypothetical protein
MNQTLDMSGTVDDDFQSVTAQRTTAAGEYVNGKYVDAAPTTPDDYTVTLQPVSDREIQILTNGGERLTDARRVYINDGDLESLANGDIWNFDGVDGVFRVVKLDNRPWRNYCKLIVSRKDDA